MTDDVVLLRRYATEGCEAAFSELVERYLPLVYSAALRQVGGDHQMAEDAAQHVFAELARCSGKLSPAVIVPGWLYRATRFTAAKLVRAEKRRRAREAAVVREQETHAMNDPHTSPNWDSVSSQLDEAMNELGDEERNAILLRFFQQLDFRAVGAALKTSDDTAQKRVSRALDKLRLLLARRGVALSAAGLGTLLAANAVSTPPQGLTLSIIAGMGAGTTATVVAATGHGTAGFAARFLTVKTACGAGLLLLAAAALTVWNLKAAASLPATIPPGVVSWWTADGDASDRAGSNHGLIEGNVTYVPGVVGQAFHFDGREGTRLKVPHSASLSLTNECTLEFWFRPDEDSVMGSLIMKRTEDASAGSTGNRVNYGFTMGRLHLDHQWGICQFFNDPEQKGGHHARLGGISLWESLFPNIQLPWSGSRFVSKDNLFEQSAFFPTKDRDLAVLRGHWHHLAGTFKQVDAAHVRMASYFDGEMRNQIIMPGCLANTLNDAPLSIGGFPTSPFKGCIDEVRVFNRELGAREVKGVFLYQH